MCLAKLLGTSERRGNGFSGEITSSLQSLQTAESLFPRPANFGSIARMWPLNKETNRVACIAVYPAARLSVLLDSLEALTLLVILSNPTLWDAVFGQINTGTNTQNESKPL